MFKEFSYGILCAKLDSKIVARWFIPAVQKNPGNLKYQLINWVLNTFNLIHSYWSLRIKIEITNFTISTFLFFLKHISSTFTAKFDKMKAPVFISFKIFKNGILKTLSGVLEESWNKMHELGFTFDSKWYRFYFLRSITYPETFIPKWFY